MTTRLLLWLGGVLLSWMPAYGTAAAQAADRWESLRPQRGPSGPYMVMEDAELFAAMDLSRSGLEGVRKAVEGKRFGEAYAAWGHYWAARPKPVWLFDPAAYRRALRRFVCSGWVPLQKGFPPTCFWLIDETFAAALRDRRPSRQPAFTSVLLPDSGFAVLRDGWQPDASAMVLDCGRPTGGHAYPGKLSFVLYLRGVPVALQPGSPLSYSLPVYGNWCDQTVSHNTVVVNDRSPEGPFFADVVHWNDLGSAVLAGAKTEVYRPAAGVTHRRLVTLLPHEYFVVFDLLEGGSPGTRLTCDAAHALLRFRIIKAKQGTCNQGTEPAALPTLVAMVKGEVLRLGETNLIEAQGLRAVVLQRTPAGWQGRAEAERGAFIRLLAPAGSRAFVAGQEVPLRREGDQVVLSVEGSRTFEIK